MSRKTVHVLAWIALLALVLIVPVPATEDARCDGSENCFSACAYLSCNLIYQDFAAYKYISGGCIGFNCAYCCCIGLGM